MEMGEERLKHSDLTRTIIGCAMRVHATLGNGFQERIYQRALAIELEIAGMPFAEEVEMDITYRNRLLGTRRMDMLVARKIMVELKAVKKLEDDHLNQAINYLEAYRLETGLLINFGCKSLEFRRVINSKHIERR